MENVTDTTNLAVRAVRQFEEISAWYICLGMGIKIASPDPATWAKQYRQVDATSPNPYNVTTGESNG